MHPLHKGAYRLNLLHNEKQIMGGWALLISIKKRPSWDHSSENFYTVYNALLEINNNYILKGQGVEREGLLKINQYLLYMRIWFIYFYADLFKRKIKTKFSLAFMKTLAILFRKRHPSEFFLRLFLLTDW
jgi:hypothetical protein